MNNGSVTSLKKNKKDPDPDIDVFTCPLCLRHYSDPKQLDCLHNFCEGCLKTYITSKEKKDLLDGKFTCPICHIPTSISVPASNPETWTGQLPDNSLITSLAEGVPLNSETQVCTPCKREGKTSAAKHWCRDCFEPLCEFCKGIHRKIKQITGHRIIPLEEARNKPGNHRLEPKTDETCTEHKGKTVELFCPGHRKLCCVVCFATNHRECHGIKMIDELVTDIKSTGELAEVVDAMTEIVHRADEQIADKSQATTLLNLKYAELTEKIELLTQKAIERLELLREESLRRFEKFHIKETKALEHRMSVLQSSKLAMDLDLKYLEAVAKHGSSSMLFITSERLRHQIGFHREILTVDKEKTEDLDYRFDFNEHFLATAEKITSLGKLRVKRSNVEENNHVNGEQGLERNAPVIDLASRSLETYTVMSGKIPHSIMGNPEPFSLKLIKEKDYNGSTPNERRIVWFTGGMFMADGVHFLMADYNNHKLKKFKKDVYYPVMEFPLESAPCDVTAANNDDEIIVTLPHVCRIAHYRINNEGLKLLGAITTHSAPEGVASMGDKIVVSFGDCIKILGEEGVEIQMIPTLESFTYTAPVVVSRDNQKIFHRDGEAIVCRSSVSNFLNIWEHVLRVIGLPLHACSKFLQSSLCLAEHELMFHEEFRVPLFQAPAGTSKESNPDKIEVHGPGIEPEGVLGEFDPTFNVKTQGAGPGRLGVNIRGPKGSFNVKMEKHTEDKTIIVCSYEANEPGDYVISVTWGDIEVRGSPFKVNLQNKT